MLCIVMWCTTLQKGQFHRFLFFCFVLLCYVLWCDVPPFIKVNTIDSYSFVMYCYVMYCDVIYHPSSRSIPPLLILLLCIVMICIVRSRTTPHHSPFHQVKVIRNSEVLLPNFLWWYSIMPSSKQRFNGVVGALMKYCDSRHTTGWWYLELENDSSIW